MSHTIESAALGGDFITTAIRIPRAVLTSPHRVVHMQFSGA